MLLMYFNCLLKKMYIWNQSDPLEKQEQLIILCKKKYMMADWHERMTLLIDYNLNVIIFYYKLDFDKYENFY